MRWPAVTTDSPRLRYQTSWGGPELVLEGARIAAVFTSIAAVFGEWTGSSSGLGHMILQDNAQLETARVFAAFFVLSAIALALFGLIALAERRIVTWR